MSIRALQALTLVGPTRENLLLDPLAELHLDNRLFINDNSGLNSFRCCHLNGQMIQTGDQVLLPKQCSAAKCQQVSGDQKF